MKKKIKTLSVVLSFLFLAGCTSPKTFDEMTVEERIEAAADYAGISACIKDSGIYRSNYTDEEKDALFEKIKVFLFTEGNINETYYYNEQFIPGTFGQEQYGSALSYSIVVYGVDGEEIYLVPADVAPTDPQDIPGMTNAEEYKYKAVRDGNVGFYDSDDVECKFNFDLHRVSDGYELSIQYLHNSKLLDLYGNLPQQLDDEGKKTMPSQTYYADEETSISIAQSEYDEAVAKKEAEKDAKEKLKKSAPKVGMSKSEVEQCAWGSPKKKNVDTYSWGTTEQWVYSRGYVYFRNGIVTSVSTSG